MPETELNGMLASGTRLGSYEIIAPLGGGGMGRIYRARDTRLGRQVAIKVLAPELAADAAALARLKREAQTASSLQNPSIVTIFDIGEAPEIGSSFFIAMELVDGVNLREWLRAAHTEAEIIDVLAQTAGGLAAAHLAGVIHRDMKPENVMVARDGLVKIVDFGLAKAVGAGSASSYGNTAPTDAMLTSEGQIVGTLAYMSPEQLKGERLDWRSDIFSFGCIIYEAFTKRAPFAGVSAADTAGRILHAAADPLPQSCHPRIAAAVMRCLEKDVSRRAISASEVATALRSALSGVDLPAAEGGRSKPARPQLPVVAAATVALLIAGGSGLWFLRKPPSSSAQRPPDPAAMTIAVLPFQTIGSAGNDYVTAGLTDSLTTELAKEASLTVIAKSSASRYGDLSDLREASKALGVRYLLVGTAQRTAGRVRINARLVDTSSNAHVWADQFDTEVSDFYGAEEAIARAVTRRLVPAAKPRPSSQPADPRIADLYLKARFYADDPDWNVQHQSIPLLEQVVALDPQFVPARLELAGQYQREAFSRDPERKWEQLAYVQIEKILAQNPAEAAAYVLRGNLRYTLGQGFQIDAVLSDIDRAIELNPNLAVAYQARGSALMHAGLLDEALADFNVVHRLDPLNKEAAYRVPRIHMYQQKCAQAVLEFRKQWPDDFQLPIALDCAGQPDAALATAERIIAERRNSPGRQASDIYSAGAVLYAKRGRHADALRAIDESIRAGEGSSHFHHAMYFIAVAYAQMHDPSKALHWLERTAREGMPCYELFARDPLLDPVRSDPAIRQFLDEQRTWWEQLRQSRARAAAAEPSGRQS